MVHTRHSYNKDHDEDYHQLNGHDDQMECGIDAVDMIHDEGGRTARETQNDNDNKSESHDNPIDLKKCTLNKEAPQNVSKVCYECFCVFMQELKLTVCMFF